ncbi:MAG: glycoside hydrolase family 43 C-terminal domain-containing protein [Crocinitomicaceae bacterium]|nr:hypothetical protein [Crocinitomicaceae bacterium]
MRQLLWIPLLFLFACSKNGISEKDVVGEWKTTECDIELSQMNETMEAIVQNIALSTEYSFIADGSWTSTNDQGDIQKGRWDLNEEKQELTLTSSDSEYSQIWKVKNDSEFEYLFENKNIKERRVIAKK